MGPYFLGKERICFSSPHIKKHKQSEYVLLDRKYGPQNGFPNNFIICDDTAAPEVAILAVSNAYNAKWIRIGLEFEIVALEHQLPGKGPNYEFSWLCELGHVQQQFDTVSLIDYIEARVLYLKAIVACHWMVENPLHQEGISRALAMADTELKRLQRIRDGCPQLS